MTRIFLLSLATLSLASGDTLGAQPLPGGPKATCRWDKPQGTQAIPGCGIPRRVRVESPAGIERLMFAKDDNPTLTRYLYRSRAIGAPVKVFKRMVNVTKTDLVVCPSDFQKARILAFRDMKGKAIHSRPTCELGAPKPGGPGAARPGAARPGAARPESPSMSRPAGAGATTSPGAAMAPRPRSVSEAIERRKPVTNRDLLRLRRSLKMDSLARLLGILGLLFGVSAFAGVLILGVTLRRRVRRLERDLDRSRAADA